jgi:hypothetical protein
MKARTCRCADRRVHQTGCDLQPLSLGGWPARIDGKRPPFANGGAHPMGSVPTGAARK